jgi:branched-chain amino acid transport system substrate-binding protein
MAVEDAGGSVLGKPVEIIFADHQNKADIGMAVARRWFEAAAVDMAMGFDNSAVALAVEQLAATSPDAKFYPYGESRHGVDYPFR